MPQGTVDAIVEAAHLVTALQTVVSRNKVSCIPRFVHRLSKYFRILWIVAFSLVV